MIATIIVGMMGLCMSKLVSDQSLDRVDLFEAGNKVSLYLEIEKSRYPNFVVVVASIGQLNM